VAVPVALLVCTVLGASLFAETNAERLPHDVGVRAGAAGAGAPLEGIGVYERKFFLAGRETLLEVTSITGSISETGLGLGPRFNLDSCAGCHAYPAPGGSSPSVNPQIRVATEHGATNRVPWFVKRDGPVRVARFKLTPEGAADGAVHPLFTISGRTDQPAPTCQLPQPDFDRDKNNLAFRIPTPLFGLGLVEAIPDSEIVRNLTADDEEKRTLGIAGRVSRSPMTGACARFGWKAQQESLLGFAAEAYHTEIGVTNELFPTEPDVEPGCLFNANPEDHIKYSELTNERGASEIELLAAFMRLSAPPLPAPVTESIRNGGALFSSVGCSLCHTPELKTGNSVTPALNRKVIQPYSDFLLHHMGPALADGISQGSAGPDEFRTAPLWGIGQRIFFLHDGRTSDLLEAIEWHAPSSASGSVRGQKHGVRPSEASGVIRRFQSLSSRQQQDVLDFLRSL
jgi:CxxC motif-containing protein (DUF1111 family)